MPTPVGRAGTRTTAMLDPRPEAAVRVLIVDECLCASLLAEFIERQPGIDVAGIAVDLSGAIEQARTCNPDLVLMEVQLRGSRERSPVAALHDVVPDLKVVVLTRRTDLATVHDAFDAGCVGFLTKRQSPSDIVRAIHSAVSGDIPVDPALLTQLLGTDPPVAASSGLTPRERSVLQLFAEGRTYSDVAARLALSVNTVRNHAQHILDKLGAHSKLEAVLIARRLGLVKD